MIPPGDANHEVRAVRPIKTDTSLTTMMPYKHVRGKDAKYTIRTPMAGKKSYCGCRAAISTGSYAMNWNGGCLCRLGRSSKS